MQESFRMSLRYAYIQKALLWLFPPDALFSNTTLNFSLDKINLGHGAVAIPTGGLRVNVEEFQFLGDFFDYHLVDMFFLAMHEETKQHFINTKYFFPNR